MKSDFYQLTRERNYKRIKGRVVVEERIENPCGDLKDYKFFCYHGQPTFIQVDGERFTDHKRDIYDMAWNRINVQYEYANFETPLPKPKMLNELIETARRLSQQFHFVRVDLYCTGDKIYFGELTFTPGSG